MLYYITLFIVALAAAVMPDSFWPTALACLAAAVGAAALFTLANYNSILSDAIRARIKPPSRVKQYGVWVAILIPTGLVHWFPLVCLLFYFAVESCVYEDLRS